MSRELTLTAIEVRMDKLLLLRSVLRAVSKKTVDRWTFSDDPNAHVAISSTPAPARGSVSARLSAVSPTKQIVLVDSESASSRNRESLSYPVRPAEFIELLNSISDSLTTSESTQPRHASVPNEAGIPAQSGGGEYRFAFALRDLLRLASRHPYRIRANGVELTIVPATRSLLRAKPLEETAILRLIQSGSDVHMSPMSEREIAPLTEGGAKPMSIDALLWRIGLECQSDRLLPDLPQAGYFALKRWPDFGGMAPNRNHLRMASVLTLSAKSVGELAQASESTVQQARCFINACALLDLVEIREKASNAPPIARQQPAAKGAPRKLFGGVVKSIRSALGLGGD